MIADSDLHGNFNRKIDRFYDWGKKHKVIRFDSSGGDLKHFHQSCVLGYRVVRGCNIVKPAGYQIKGVAKKLIAATNDGSIGRNQSHVYIPNLNVLADWFCNRFAMYGWNEYVLHKYFFPEIIEKGYRCNLKPNYDENPHNAYFAELVKTMEHE